VLENTDRLMTELVRIPGVRLNSRTAPARRSGIVSFGHETIAPGQIYQGLRERGISCALREGGVRVSPHFYQGESELGVFFDALAHIV
jgi:selenocysteine lyase/cysteine desulfurase